MIIQRRIERVHAFIAKYNVALDKKKLRLLSEQYSVVVHCQPFTLNEFCHCWVAELHTFWTGNTFMFVVLRTLQSCFQELHHLFTLLFCFGVLLLGLCLHFMKHCVCFWQRLQDLIWCVSQQFALRCETWNVCTKGRVPCKRTDSHYQPAIHLLLCYY